MGNSGMVGLLLLKRVATSLITQGSPTLKKGHVEDCLQRCSDVEIKKACEAILAQFSGNCNDVDILGNEALDKELKKMATLVTSYVTKANATVADTVLHVLDQANGRH
ncbi:hypothetical protein EC973_001492 [Apophysomyces ossiformis]|uniref:Uncharacterized protein n=1 Tax=Apophysomyces ossiformis TaxID=679940 RepID=A0A8H7BHS6_9FUNG|nr:hypothetical protein EC973_001492 [Apophysomyces ossiformis]